MFQFSLGTTLTFIAMAGFVSNSMVLYGFGRSPKSRKRHFFIMNLAFMGALSSVTYGIACYYLFFGQELMHNACKAEAFIISVLLLGSIFQLTVISVERCAVIWRPFFDKKIFMSHKCIVVGLIYLLSIAISCPPLFGWSRFRKVQQQFYCTFDFAGRDAATRSYMVFLLACGYVIPILAIGFSYGSIFYLVRRSGYNYSKIRIRRLTDEVSFHSRVERKPSVISKTQYCSETTEKNCTVSTNLLERTSSAITSQLLRSERRHQIRIAILMLTVCGSFVLCWTPIAFLSVVWPIFSGTLPSPTLLTFGAMCGKTFVIINPAIYGFSSKAFRTLVRRLFWHKENVKQNDCYRVMRSRSHRLGSTI